MFQTDLSQRIQKLKEEEEKQLAELRLKRFFESEAMKKEIEKRNEEEELKNLTAKENHLMKKLSEMRIKTFRLKMEATSWEKLEKSKTEELKNLEGTLNECYGRIWTNRENFCHKIDTLLEDRTTFTKSTPPQFVENATDEDVRKLKESISAEENLDRVYTKTISELQEEKENLNQLHNSERKRLEEWIQITRDRCSELNRRIQEKRELTDMETTPSNNQLFSIVNLEDVKKLTQNWK